MQWISSTYRGTVTVQAAVSTEIAANFISIGTSMAAAAI